MRSFVRIHIIFAMSLIMAMVVWMGLVTWLGHLHELDDPGHVQFYRWEPRIEAIGFGLKYGTTIPWFLFAVYHAVVVIRKKFQSEDKH